VNKILVNRARAIAKRSLFRFDKVLLNTTGVEEALELIRKLRPLNSGHELVRVGSINDGGYLLPKDFQGIDGLFSPGVANDCSFEKYFAELGLKCFLADRTVSKPPEDHPNFSFLQKHISAESTELTISLSDWVNTNSISTNLLLQMDIEGAEYEVIMSTDSTDLRKFRILTIEFHGIDRIVNKDGFLVLNTTFKKLLKDFIVVHVHPNNNGGLLSWKGLLVPRLLEVTFLRKDRVKSISNSTEFPHSLDSLNVPEMQDIILPPEWHH
jgi:hypothetical protein